MKNLIFATTFFTVIITTSAKAIDCDVFQFNQCISCDASYAFKVAHADDCERYCPNRNLGDYFLDKTARCILISCPENKPYRSKTGSCYGSLADANEDLDNEKENTNNDNILEGEWFTAPSAIDGKCPDDKPLLYSGKCFSCQEPRNYDYSKEDCAKCPNRVYKEYPHLNVKHCELQCPEDKPLQRWDGKCFSCDEEKAIRLPTHCNIEHDCEDWCPNRTILYAIGGNILSIPNCPTDKPLMDSAGICHECDEIADIFLDYNERLCEKSCPTQRYLDGNVCKLKNNFK